LFLSDLIKNTADSDPAKTSLHEARELADDLASQLDKSKDFADRLHKIVFPRMSLALESMLTTAAAVDDDDGDLMIGQCSGG
jgi:hypothetical protein